MARFNANFLKTVCDSTGHERTICQRSLVVDARNKAEAIERAKQDFCRLEEIPSWFLHADALQVERFSAKRRAEGSRRVHAPSQEFGNWVEAN